MLLNDKIDFYGVFSFKSLDADGKVLDEYTEKNLIMDEARTNMAQLVGGVTTSGDVLGSSINKFTLGTLGHMVGENILVHHEVGAIDPSKPTTDKTFHSGRTNLFSEETSNGTYYEIPFVATGAADVYGGVSAGSTNPATTVGGTLRQGGASYADTGNQVRRQVVGSTVTYTVTIPATNANSKNPGSPVIAYTEAALYAGGEIFSMKTFPARVKEDTVKFEITWSIIF